MTKRTVGLFAVLVVCVATFSAAMLFLHRLPILAAGRQAIRGVTIAQTSPPPPWTETQLRELIEAVDGAAAQGLKPSDYDFPALRAALDAHHSGQVVNALADHATLALAHDYAAGHIRNRHRFNWYIPYVGPPPADLAEQIVKARQAGTLRNWLTGLLPDEPAYAKLRQALDETPFDEERRRDRIKANMERWRWLPRGFGKGDMLYVNLPTYRLDVMQHGERSASYKAVIGATDMPTPVVAADVRRVVVNPDWIVPQSIVRKSHLRPGASSHYEFSTRPDGTLRVRQKPGAGNALGKIKIDFPNPLAIYFHDTPSRSLFGRDVRAFSHGCVRVQHVDALAALLVPDQVRFSAALAGDETRSFAVSRPWRAVIVYLTFAENADGDLVDVGDPYKLDEAMAAALAGRRVLPAVPASTSLVRWDAPTPKPHGKPNAAAAKAPKIDAATLMNDQL